MTLQPAAELGRVSQASKLGLLTGTSILWLALWAGINTGPWVLNEEHGSLLSWVHLLRAFLPHLALVVGGLWVSSVGWGSALSGPVGLWLVYGLVSTLSCWMSPAPLNVLYWALAYLAPFPIVALVAGRPGSLGRLTELNHLTWLCATLCLVALVVLARETLADGYGAFHRMEEVGGMAMSRSSGMARFAAVPAILAFVYLMKGTGGQRMLAAPAFAGSAALIYHMQSRGAILALAGSIAFMLFFIGPTARRAALLLAVCILVLAVADALPGDALGRISEHLRRGQSDEQLTSLTGRTGTWEQGWAVFLDSPLIGFGPQADRAFLQAHAHNTLLYALLCSGILGATAFVAGFVVAWRALLRQLFLSFWERRSPDVLLLQVGGIIAFFSIRSIPEVCGALFGVDTLVLLPAIAYLWALDRRPFDSEEAT